MTVSLFQHRLIGSARFRQPIPTTLTDCQARYSPADDRLALAGDRIKSEGMEGQSMGFGRDLGAAFTFGLAATTKHKEAEVKYETRRKQHQRRLTSYNGNQAQIQSSVEAMDAHFTAAQELLLSTGALTSDVNNNVICREQPRLCP